MADSDIQEQINIFMEKLEKSKVPKKASGEAIVSGKPEKVKLPKKGSLIPTFKDIGINGFQVIDKNNKYYGKLLKLALLVGAPPVYASEMSPSLKLMAMVFAETKWAAKFKAINVNGDNIPLFQACVLLGGKLDEWGQSKDWEKIKKHMPDNKEALIEAENAMKVEAFQAIQADQEEPGNIPFSAEENAAYYSQFLKELVEVVTTLAAVALSDGTLIPEQPINLYKAKGKWKAAIVPMQMEKEKETGELSPLPPGPEEEEKPGILVLTQPVKIRSPGDNKVAVPPTFIPIPPGLVSIKQFIWTIPLEVPSDTECQVVVGYGADTYVLKGTFESVSEAPPFKLDKGGVLKVSIQTTMPMEAWLELELKVEAPAFIVKLGEMFSPSPQPLPQLAAPAEEKQKEPATPDEKLKMAMAELADAQQVMLTNLEQLENIAQEALGPEQSASVKEVIEGQMKKVKQIPTSPLGSIDLKTGETGETVPADHPSEGVKGYKPKITALNINGKAIDAKQMADAFRSHLKSFGFIHYMIDGSDHEYKKTKGILMHFKITWAGDPELNLIKWALTTIPGQHQLVTISIHYKVGAPILLLDCLRQLAHDIKPKK